MNSSRRPWLVAALLWVIAVVAVAITVPVAITRRSGPVPAAPGLAALTNEQLFDLLPGQADFPAGWTNKPYPGYSDNFGYWRYHRAEDLGKTTPEECADVADGDSADTSLAVEIAADAPTRAAPSRYSGQVHVEIGREFRPAGFDEMVDRAYRCKRFRNGMALFRTQSTVQVLEDSRPRGRPQIFRYSVTTDFGGPDHATTVRHYAYARVSRLILSGSCRQADRPLFDRLFAQTLGRIVAAGG